MRLGSYLWDKRAALVLALLAFGFTAFFLVLLNVSFDGICLIEGILIVSFLAMLVIDFSKRKRYYDVLLEVLDSLDRKTLLTEVAPELDFSEARIQMEMLREVQKYTNDRISDYDTEAREYREYVETWVHEIKNPIASAKLIIENDKNITTLNIGEELDKVEGFVEQALYYARSGNVEQDYSLKEVSLKEIVMPEIRRYSKEMIRAGVRPQLDHLDSIVPADMKWCGFVVGQILGNAIKYRGSSQLIRIYGETSQNRVSLIIKDQGIGISAKDLKRVFQKGFTGENGRRYSKSTGIGLFLCKKLCGKMGLGIEIRSVLGEGTAVELIFPKGSMTSGAGAELSDQEEGKVRRRSPRDET